MMIQIMILLCFEFLHGQVGVYTSAEAFVKKSLRHAGKNTRIRLLHRSSLTLVSVKCEDSTFRYQTAELFGYRDKDGNDYRFYNNFVLPIANPDETILLYKKTSGTGLKNSPVTEEYYFSKDAGSDIMPLTCGAIETAFSDNTVFTLFVELTINSDEDLRRYDPYHGMYKLNRLLQLSKNFKALEEP